MQPGQTVGRQAQHRQRQALDQGAIFAGGHQEAVLPSAGQGRRGVRDVRHHGAGGDAAASQPGADARQQRRLAAEQLGTAGDVQHQPVRRVRGRFRREAQRPERQPLQQGPVRFQLGRAQHQVGIHRLRVGQRLPGVQPRARRVHRRQQAPVADRGPARQRLIPQRRVGLPQPIRRQRGQVQHQEAGSDHA